MCSSGFKPWIIPIINSARIQYTPKDVKIALATGSNISGKDSMASANPIKMIPAMMISLRII